MIAGSCHVFSTIPYAAVVITRRILAVFAALAVLLAPAIATASTPVTRGHGHAPHAMQMGDCQSPPTNGDHHDKAGSKSCCASACAAVAVAPGDFVAFPMLSHQGSYFAIPTAWHGYLGEIATPPPRSA